MVFSRVLVLDPATSTGYALFKLRVRSTGKIKGILYEYGFLEIDTSSEYQGDHCLDLSKKVEEIIIHNAVDCVALEDYFFSKKFANGSTANAAYRTAIHMLCRSKSIPYTILNVSLWKTYVAGRATPTKIQKKQWGKMAKKYFIQDALWRGYKIRFPNHVLSSKGRKIRFRSDIVDAVAMGIYFCKMVLKIDELECRVSVVEDDPKIKGGYSYL